MVHDVNRWIGLAALTGAVLALSAVMLALMRGEAILLDLPRLVASICG